MSNWKFFLAAASTWDGFVRVAKYYIWGTDPNMRELPFYRAFLKIPSLISAGVLFLWLTIYTILLFRVLSGYWGGLLTVPLLALGAFLGIIGRSMMKIALFRRQIAKRWGSKFPEWQDLAVWLQSTPYGKLNELVETKEDWMPNPEGGVFNTKFIK